MAALTEFELIARFFRRPGRSAVLGVGDDAALLQPAPGCELAVSVDMLVAGRHFFADVDPESLGHKTLAVNLSDMAAMGATPRWALLAGALPQARPEWLAAFAHGFFALADAHGVELVGGDTTCGPLTLCITIIGEVPQGRALKRSGAKPGDAVWVSGALGDAALALAHYSRDIELSSAELATCERALQRPNARIALGERLRGVASAAIDLSDGLTGDLAHVMEESRVGARVRLGAIPRSAAMEARLRGSYREVALRCLLAGGDDYELCFTAPPERTAEVEALGRELGLEMACIGTVTEGSTLTIDDETGHRLERVPRAFDHFAE
jgi:thiamine-monophosphate kinase